MKSKNLVIGALLTSLALVIPIYFGGYLRIYIPPFSATLASHVPVMLAFLVSPLVAVMVGLGSTIGFLVMLGPVIAARAFIHVIFGYVGAKLIDKGYTFEKALLLTAPLHALGESLVVLPFGFPLYTALVLVGIGTLLHHFADSIISVILARTVLSGIMIKIKN
ncbi:niacin transporter [Caldanaerovirga acetigignens]|jgi:niacin transporter|uniref:Niacin transporter n=1 Tax=Caldanaerovirga acetigignens TaxID=447595 RepID=A0A1M7KNB4_9FIRM|nr:ECF transporter S component [Caldanaerovirga acetigignens]SHM66987.1 niacin transporter [Caldanaerovirga acetigignens]